MTVARPGHPRNLVSRDEGDSYIGQKKRTLLPRPIVVFGVNYVALHLINQAVAQGVGGGVGSAPGLDLSIYVGYVALHCPKA